MREIIETRELTKYYGKQRGIEQVNLSIREGELFGFIGPNGAGKSTAIRTILGLLSPTSGEVRLFDSVLTEKKQECMKRIGYMPSEAELLPGHESKGDSVVFRPSARKGLQSGSKKALRTF